MPKIKITPYAKLLISRKFYKSQGKLRSGSTFREAKYGSNYHENSQVKFKP